NFDIKKVKAGAYALAISLLGYVDTVVAVEIKSNETILFKLQLRRTYADLREVILEARLHHNYVETKTSESLRFSLPLIEVPQNIAVVPRQLLVDQGLLSVAEAIRNVSGIQKDGGSLNDYSLNIRGIDATWNVSRNGVGAAAYWWNQQEDVAMIEKI